MQQISQPVAALTRILELKAARLYPWGQAPRRNTVKPSRYDGATLRRLRAERGVGRPPACWRMQQFALHSKYIRRAFGRDKFDSALMAAA